MGYTITIDWLSFTLHPQKGERPDVLQLLCPDGIMEPDRPHFGYERPARTAQGAVVMSSPDNPRMGVHASISGAALLSYRDNGTTALQLLQSALASQAKITRLDLAKDAKEQGFDLREFERNVSEGAFNGASHKGTSVKSSDGGLTVYVGSRQSDKFLRVYDKGVESRQGGDWVRAELELKGDVAKAAGKALADGIPLNELFCAMARRMCTMNHVDWNNLLKADSEIGLPKIEKQSDREKWIAQQVTPAVIQHAMEHPDSEALERLWKDLTEALHKW